MTAEDSREVEHPKKSGRCRICDERFVWMNRGEYKRTVSWHIWENHRDEQIDKPLVVADG